VLVFLTLTSILYGTAAVIDPTLFFALVTDWLSVIVFWEFFTTLPIENSSPLDLALAVVLILIKYPFEDVPEIKNPNAPD
jgi:hypothetical protein